MPKNPKRLLAPFGNLNKIQSALAFLLFFTPRSDTEVPEKTRTLVEIKKNTWRQIYILCRKKEFKNLEVKLYSCDVATDDLLVNCLLFFISLYQSQAPTSFSTLKMTEIDCKIV